MKLLVSGSSGFIGRHVVSQALAGGHSVVALGRPSRMMFPPHHRLRLLECGLAEVPVSGFAGCDALIHLAAQGVITGSDDWRSCIQVNVSDSLILWQKAVLAGVGTFVVAGSCFEYGRGGEIYESIPPTAALRPTGAYASSKAAASVAALGLAAERGLRLTVLRPFQVFGEGEGANRLWPSLQRAALEGCDLPLTEGQQVRDFVPVEHVAAVFIQRAQECGARPGRPTVENIGSGQPCTIRAFAERWWRHWRAKGKLQFGALPYRPNEVMRYVPLLGAAQV